MKAAANDTSASSLLEEGLAKLGLPQDKILPLLLSYIKEIELFNPAYSLVKVKDRRELVVRHILDSLAPLSVIRHTLGPAFEQKPPLIADVGSGAGLPGIPLAICMGGAEFTLIERMGRRAGFLRDALAVLGLPNVRVEEAEMEKFSLPAADRFDLIVFRAFRPLEPAILKSLFKLLAPGGALAAYKGRRQTIEEEMSRAPPAAWENHPWELVPLEVPFLEEERHLLIIRT
ncbi:MAG: 16S rRNA (guanine(527)-N(7))-methyltransferase RsmG [Treponema sp.]|jgi:16S rRNA (guanine527-N7)-methyltransferase|nr:16S rRNA (guanine(527)-N(7))-methyltransferase RsmG [Treponema sp.]